MKRVVILLLGLLTTVSFVNATIWYVSPGGQGQRTGTSWANAAPTVNSLFQLSTLPLPIPNSNPYPSNNDTIWVAAGTYPSIIIHAGGYMVNGVQVNRCPVTNIHIYGGFAGNETQLSQRLDWRSNETIISPLPGQHGVWFEGDSAPLSVTFDGFTISNTSSNSNCVRAVNALFWVSHCVIKNNNTVPFFFENLPCYVENKDTILSTIIDVAVFDNQITVPNTQPYYNPSLIISCSSNVKFVNTTLTRNLAYDENTPLIYFYSNPSTIKFYNSILYDNGGANLIVDNAYSISTIKVNNSIIELSSPSSWRAYKISRTNITTPPELYKKTYILEPYSPAIRNGNASLYLSSHPLLMPNWAFKYYDIDGNHRFEADGSIDIGAFQLSGNLDQIKYDIQNTRLEFNEEQAEFGLSSYENITADIYSITGQLIQSNAKEPLKIELPGVYIVKYYDENNLISVKKLVITK